MRLRRVFAGVLVVAVLMAAQAIADESPHWNKATCDTCHTGASPTAATLRQATAEIVCMECHGDRGGAVKCRHRSDLPVGGMAVPGYYGAALVGGRITCTTCHDLTFQCNNPNVAYSLQNRGFLRNRVSHDSADQCFECHDKQQVAALNPHKGTIRDSSWPTCLLCHEQVPQSTASGAVDVSFNMRQDLNDMCRGCHNLRPHPRGMSFGTKPEGWVHLAKPSTEVLGKMQRWEAATGMKLPLSPYNGEIYCATCHNPHEFEGGPAAQQHEYRLRTDDVCQACHEK
jgi:predicted CXXCH cytochrome family protein